MFIDSTSFDELRDAARNRPLIPFIGAGVSQLAGCPGWDEFANDALCFFVKKGQISHAEYDQLRSLSSRIKLSMALDLERKHSTSIDFERLLQSSSKEKEEKGNKVYENLARISNVFVTTNYDQKLDTGERRIFFKREELTVQNLMAEKNAVYHIHGSVKDTSTMIRTTDEYLQLYANHDLAKGEDGENPFLTFLSKLFETRTVLFIGYSLGELEVLEYILQKNGAGQVERRHFMLQGFFSHQQPLIQNLSRY